MYERFLDFFGNQSSPMNSTYLPSPCPTFVSGETVCLPPLKIPFYFALRQSLLDGIPDTYLALAAPVLSYWVLSLLFHCLDISGWRWLDKYRIHESEEVKSKNLATPREVAWAVVLQHVIQTGLGIAWLSASPEISVARCQDEMEGLGRTLVWVVRHLAGEERGLKFLELCGPEVTHWLYWWGVPAAQILFALYVCSPSVMPLSDDSQVHSRHLAILPPPLDAHQQVSIQKYTLRPPQALCAICIRRIVQPSCRGLLAGQPRCRYCREPRTSHYTADHVRLCVQHMQDRRRPLWIQPALRSVPND